MHENQNTTMEKNLYVLLVIAVTALVNLVFALTGVTETLSCDIAHAGSNMTASVHAAVMGSTTAVD